MKARIMNKPQGKILMYGMESETEKKLCGIAKSMKLEGTVISADSASQKVGYLAGFTGFSKTDESSERSEQCVIFSCIDGKTLNILLDKMRAEGLSIPLKAAVTAYNQSMTLSELIDELKDEHSKLHPNG